MAVMSQRCKNRSVTRRDGFIALWLLLAIAPTVSVAQDPSSAYDSRESITVEPLPAGAVMSADLHVPQFEASSVISAALCFAVGFGACLLVVHYMLPLLVRAQCVEVVREYIDLVRRESEIRVVVLDRESHQPRQKPRRASIPDAETQAEWNYESQHHRRVDRPIAPAVPVDRHAGDAPNSMLSQVYEQNLHLRDQLRKQIQSVKP